jgi:transcriptional regulator with XRE-family HTH domain
MPEQARMTLEEAARRLEKTRSSLHRIEQGQTRADIHLVKSMMDLYDVYDDELGELVRQAAKSGWWRAYGLADYGYVDVETEASSVLDFGGLNIPGLLQTEAYTHALLRTGRRRTDAELRNDVAVRAIRQERLRDEEQPLELTAIIDQAALTREVGGREVMHGQLLRLVEAAALPMLTLQLLPFHTGAHDAMNGAFTVLTFPEPDESDLLYVAYPSGAVHLEAEDEVRAAKLVFARLRSQALPPQDSVALVERLAAELYGGP